MRKTPIAVLVALSLAACAAAGPDFTMAPAPADVATVYIYRPASQNGAISSPDVFVGEEKVFALQNGGYGVLALPPGEHQIIIKTGGCYPPLTHQMIARGGEQTFIRFSMPTPTRPAPTGSAGHWAIDLFLLPAQIAAVNKWSEEQCQLTRPGLDALDKGAAGDEIAKTKLIDGGSAGGITPKSLSRTQP